MVISSTGAFRRLQGLSNARFVTSPTRHRTIRRHLAIGQFFHLCPPRCTLATGFLQATQTLASFENGCLFGAETDRVVNPSGPAEQRAREFWRECWPGRGGAALSCDFRRTLSRRNVAVSRCQKWRKTRNAGSGCSRRCALTGGSQKSSRLEKAPRKEPSS